MGLHFKKWSFRKAFPHRQHDTGLLTQPGPQSAIRVQEASVCFSVFLLTAVSAEGRSSAWEAVSLPLPHGGTPGGVRVITRQCGRRPTTLYDKGLSRSRRFEQKRTLRGYYLSRSAPRPDDHFQFGFPSSVVFELLQELSNIRPCCISRAFAQVGHYCSVRAKRRSHHFKCFAR